MGLERFIAGGFDPSTRPMEGEIIAHKKDMLLAAGGEYISILGLLRRIEALEAVIDDPLFGEMVQGYKQAREMSASLQVPTTGERLF